MTTLECSRAEWWRSSEGNSHTVPLSLPVVSLCWPPQDSRPLLSSLTAKGDLILLITNKGKRENLGGSHGNWEADISYLCKYYPFYNDISKASEPLFNETVLVKVATSDTTLKCHRVQTTQHLSVEFINEGQYSPQGDAVHRDREPQTPALLTRPQLVQRISWLRGFSN